MHTARYHRGQPFDWSKAEKRDLLVAPSQYWAFKQLPGVGLSKAKPVGSSKRCFFMQFLLPAIEVFCPFPTTWCHRGWTGYRFCVAILLATPCDFSSPCFVPCKHLMQFTALLLEPDLT